MAAAAYKSIYVLRNCDLILKPEKYYSITINNKYGGDNFVGKCVNGSVGKYEIPSINVTIVEASVGHPESFNLVQDTADNTTKLYSYSDVHGLLSIDIKEVPEIYYLCYANRVTMQKLSNRIADIEEQLKTSGGNITA